MNSRETAFIDALRAFATDPAARGLNDDAAVLPTADGAVVLTHDMIVEGVHYLPGDPAEDVAWKLIAVNLSDLAAKGATPIGILLGYAMTDDDDWDAAFATGLGAAAAALGAAILGGDTVRMPAGAPRALGMTAIGRAPEAGAPSRTGARPGDCLWVSGTIGDAGAGLAMLQGRLPMDAALVLHYRRPQPRLALGLAIAPLVTAMADVSDGLLIDASRIAAASGCAIAIDLDRIPLSDALRGAGGSVMTAAAAGDDYELLFAAPEAAGQALRERAEANGVAIALIGRCEDGTGLRLALDGAPVLLPDTLGWLHG